MKFSCQSKLFWMFGSNSKFKIQTFFHYNELRQLITSSYMVRFQYFFLEKLRILVLFIRIKFHMNPRGYEWLRSILVEGGSDIDVFFATFFTVFWHFKTILQTQWVNWMRFFFTKVFVFWFESLCSLIFFHLSTFRNRISPPNVFLRKFQHLFSTLKNYNLSIYTVKWPQILFTPSTTCTLQYCTVEIFIPHWDLDL